MQDAQPPGAQVLKRAVDGAQRAVEAQRDGVDGHIAPAQVLVERARPHIGQRPRVSVGLGAGAHEVVRAAVDAHARCPEAVVGGDLTVQARGGGVDVAFDHQIELARRTLEQQVAHRAAHEVHAVARREGVQQPRAARVGAQHVDGIRRVAHSATRP